MAQILLTEFQGLPTLGSIISDISPSILEILVIVLLQRKRIQISLAATVIYLLFTALVSTVYTLHTSRRRADRTVFSVHKTQINSTKDRGS